MRETAALRYSIALGRAASTMFTKRLRNHAPDFPHRPQFQSAHLKAAGGNLTETLEYFDKHAAENHLMGQIFISHSSFDNGEAEAMRDWLAQQGWDDVFLDLDPVAGLAPGEHWRDELRKAGEQCSAVIVLVSPHWAASKWCLTEFLFAAQLGKEIFPVLIAPCPFDDMPIELSATYQFADISTPAIRDEGFERLRIGLHRAGLHPGAFPWPPEGEPNRPLFRGLRVLEEVDAAIFFGRDTRITKALDAMRRLHDGAPEKMLAILGASGAGKSSFLRAGLLARLKRDTERFLVLPTLRPARAALTGDSGLQRALGLIGPLDAASIAARLAELRAPVMEHLREHTAHRADGVGLAPPTVILPIDQAEELFVSGDAEAAAAVAAIVEVVNADPHLVLLLTIRSDSFSLLQQHPRLSGIPLLPFDLPRLSAAALKEIVEGPARLSRGGLAIDADLTEQLIEDFGDDDALPLLAFTLERLVIDHGTDGRLEKREYIDEMKGLGGAIRKAVEAAFAKAAELAGLPGTRAELDVLAQRSFVPGLVRIDDASAIPKRRIALRRRLPPEALALIDCLIDQRLLVTGIDGSEPTVEVAHEAVLRHWRELAGWIAERREELSLSERVKAAASEWVDAQVDAKAEALVHRGERLRTAEKLLLWEELHREMGANSAAYLHACRDAETRTQVAEAAQQRRQRRLRQWVFGLIAAAATVTLLGAALVVTGQRNLGRAQSLTLARTAARLAQDGDYLRALRLSILASHENWLMPTTPEARAALSSNAQALKLKTDFRGHEGPVDGAMFSTDGQRILSWSRDGTTRQWDAATGTPIGPALKHDGPVKGAVFSADGQRILSWSDDGTARQWDVATSAQIGPALKHDSWVKGAVFSADGQRILSWSEDGTARQWDAATGAPIGSALKHDGPVYGPVFSADGQRILSWSEDGTARQWDAATGAPIGPVLKLDGPVNGAVISADGQRILSWSDDGTARQWDVATSAQIGPALKHDKWVYGAMFSADGQHILSWSFDGTARQWDAATGAPIGPALKHDDPVLGAVFSADGQRILSWSHDGTARQWDAATGAPIGPALKHDDPVLGAVFSADGQRILSWSFDGTARQWDAATGAPIGPALKHDKWVDGAMFSAHGQHILSWSGDGTARQWDVATSAQIGPAIRHDGRVYGAMFSTDGQRILSWTDYDARQWDAATGAPIGPALKHDDPVLGAVFSADGQRILSWSDDGTARQWDAATGAPIGPALKHDGPVKGAVFSADGQRILSWSDDGTARQWDVATSAQIGPALKHDDPVLGAVFSADGQRILSWSDDGTARQWGVATSAQIGPALKHDSLVKGAVVIPPEISRRQK